MTKTAAATIKDTKPCYHCGDDCIQEISFDEKHFCCQGCQTVYDLLNNYGLDTYYELNNAPGTKHDLNNSEFDYLENEELATKMLDFDSERISKVTLFLPAIHCSSCIWLLENLPSLYEGIISSHVNFINKKATISFRKDLVSLKQVVLFVVSIGYKPNITSESEDKKPGRGKSLVIKMAVAGFCFGNSMLISIPAYLDINLQITDQIRSAFGLVNILLILPVVFYSAQDYFISAFLGLRQKQIGIDVPVALGIFILFLQTIIEVISHSGLGYADSLTGLVFFLLIGKWYQNKTYRALSFERTYKSFFPIAVKKITGQTEEFIPLEEITIGDHIKVSNGEVIPADGQLIKGAASIDYSFVSGESLAEEVQEGDKIFAGGRQIGMPVIIQVSKEVSSGYLTELWNQAGFKNQHTFGLKDQINKISGYFTLTILLIAVFSSVAWYIIDPSQIWKVVTSVMIIACPCALALTLPFAYGHTIRYLGRQQIFLKNAGIVESIARVKQIVFDKTGTLTRNELMKIEFIGELLSDKEEQILKLVTENSMHPYSRLIHRHLSSNKKSSYQGLAEGFTHFKETEGKGIEATVLNNEVKLGSAGFLNQIDKHNETSVHLSINGLYKGYFTIQNAYRPGIFDVLKQLKNQFTLYLISGDSDKEKQTLYPFFSSLMFKQSPADKLAFTHQLKKKGLTMMIGDGLNDAGALKIADIGIAITEDVHQFSPACDAIISGKNLHKLPQLVAFCQYAFKTVRAAFVLSFLYNLIGLYFAVTGQLTPIISAILMPLSSVTVVGMITLLIRNKAYRLFSYPS